MAKLNKTAAKIIERGFYKPTKKQIALLKEFLELVGDIKEEEGKGWNVDKEREQLEGYRLACITAEIPEDLLNLMEKGS